MEQAEVAALAELALLAHAIDEISRELDRTFEDAASAASLDLMLAQQALRQMPGVVDADPDTAPAVTARTVPGGVQEVLDRLEATPPEIRLSSPVVAAVSHSRLALSRLR